jgi:hypothetical protein
MIGNYYLLLGVFSFLLIQVFFSSKDILVKFLALYFCFYFALPFINISVYRGTIVFETLALYTLVQSVVLLSVYLFKRKGKFSPKIVEYFELTKISKILFKVQIGVIYTSLFFVYVLIGPILIKQELRFTIPPIIEYVIKTGLVLPLIFLFTNEFKFRWKQIFIYFLVPTLPCLLIGSRGTFVMTLISFFVALFLFSSKKMHFFLGNYNNIFRNWKYFFSIGIFVMILAIYSGFYIRRDGVELVGVTELLDVYEFKDNGILMLASLPLYMNLREGPGITNRIIEEDISNKYMEYPFFIAELVTILPGHQEAPGIVLSRQVYNASGNDEKYGLTPGIVGGLYLDFKYMLFFVILALALMLVWLYNKMHTSATYQIIFCISVVQFFHLYHRGFLKVEYFIPYLIIWIFTSAFKKKRIVNV